MDNMVYEHKVQYYETDQMGIVHHSNYIRWFEEARIDLLDRIGVGYNVMESAGIISPVTSVSCNYKSMTKFNERVLIEVKVLEYTGVKLKLGYIIRDKERKVVRAIGESNHCFLNENNKPISLKRSYPQFSKAFE